MTMTTTNINPNALTAIPLTDVPAITSFTSTFISRNSYEDYDCDGASKCCFLFDEEKNFVLKFPQYDEDEDENYCQMEADIYKKVPEELKKFFAETFYLGKFTDCDGEANEVYCQERVPVIAENEPECYTFEKEIYDLAEDMELDCNGSFLLYLLSKGYSEEICQELQDFFNDQGINDLHDGNWGLREDGTPVLFDFSGYYD